MKVATPEPSVVPVLVVPWYTKAMGLPPMTAVVMPSRRVAVAVQTLSV